MQFRHRDFWSSDSLKIELKVNRINKSYIICLMKYHANHLENSYSFFRNWHIWPPFLEPFSTHESTHPSALVSL